MAIAGVVTALALVAHVCGVSRGKNLVAGSAAAVLPKYMTSPSVVTAPPVPATRGVQVSTRNGSSISEQSDPREITVGPSGISSRYRLLSVERKPVSSKGDKLTVKLHVESLAIENLVSPFGSDMLEITGPGPQPITPHRSFNLPIPSGHSRNQDIVFSVPPSLSLSHSVLRIHYYNHQSEIPINVSPGKGVE
jgi:hypothetical protein